MSRINPFQERSALYWKFRCSWLYEWYAWIVRPGYSTSLKNDRQFYRRLFALYEIKSVFDLGANVGEKAKVFSELTQRVVCVEADPDLATILHARFQKDARLIVENSAVGAEIGLAKLHRKYIAGFNTLSEKWSGHSATLAVESRDAIQIPVTTLDRLIEVHKRPDYIKVDVEGYELPVIRGLTTAVPIISLEANLPLFLSETLLAIDRLVQLDSSYLFNVRGGDGPQFLFPTFLDHDQLIQFVTLSAPATYDLFAISQTNYKSDGI